MLSGLPGSGKTTEALKLEDEGWVRVNKDDLRAQLVAGGWTWSKEAEADVIAIRDGAIIKALVAGKNVVSDDTNFARQHKIRLRELAQQYKAEFEHRRITTSVDECIKRDAAREKPVGEKVIRDMATRYQIDQPVEIVKYVPDRSKAAAVICDLDGTLALFEGKRSPYDASTCAEDDINEVVRDMLVCIAEYETPLFVSGREDKFREPTLTFLERCGLGPRAWLTKVLFMRTTGDYRKDYIVKLELFNQHIRNVYNVRLVLDDRTQVVKMWRELGLQCWQVAEGDF